MLEQTHTCVECEAEFEVIHNEDIEIRHCPFCGEDLVFEEEMDWEEEEY